jgi:hypothetical protein
MRALVEKRTAGHGSSKAKKKRSTELSANQLRFIKAALAGTQTEEPSLLAGRP